MLRAVARSWWVFAGVLVLLVGCAAVPTLLALDSSDEDDPGGSVSWPGPRIPSDDEPWAYTHPGDLPEVRDAAGHRLPLRHTHVHASLRGQFADVTVAQTFRNDATDVIEIVYAFPLPENAAVSRMRLVVGERVVESEIMKRNDARRIYDDARSRGYTSALLEQERPNVFTQSIANVPPGEDIDVEIRYVQTLTWEAGEYEFVFPMVVGPRFIPGEPLPRAASGTGGKPDTDRVPDASRISPPIVGHGTRRGDDIMLEIDAQMGHPIEAWHVPTHDVQAHVDDGRLRLKLATADDLPNRDFVLRYRAAGEQPRATLLLGPRGDDGHGRYALVVQPPALDVDAIVGRREMIYVVDRSGSMSGEPLALAKEVVRQALGQLRPVDTFDVVGFESGTERLFGTPRPANAANLALALQFIDGMRASGGTAMETAVQAALGDDVADGYLRYVLFVTDGYIGHEAEIFAGARDLVERQAHRGQRARVFGIGVGSAPNRHLIDGLARAGRGRGLFVTTREPPRRAVQAFARMVDALVLEQVDLEPGSLTLDSRHPESLGDLFASHPLVAFGQYAGEAEQPPTLTASAGGKSVTIPVRVATMDDDSAMLDALWARAAVADLEPLLWSRFDPEVEAEMTRLGLAHHIVTPFTSLVAVDRSRTVGSGAPREVVVPTLAPEGVDPEMAGAELHDWGGELPDYASGVYEEALPRRSPLEGTPVVRKANRRGGRRLTHHVEVGELSGRPGVPSRMLAPALRRLRPNVKRCWARSTATAPIIVRIDLSWGHTGAPRLSVGGSLGESSSDACLRESIESAGWPQLEAGATVSFSLRLSVR